MHKTLLLLWWLLSACVADPDLPREIRQTLLGNGVTRTILDPGTDCKGSDGVHASRRGDLVVPCENHASSTASLVILWNNGDGTFDRQAFMPSAGFNLVGPEEARWFDEDGDGDEDILVTQSHRISVFRRDGTNTCEHHCSFTFADLYVFSGMKIINTVCGLGPRHFITASYSTGATVDECIDATGSGSSYACSSIMTSGWAKRAWPNGNGDCLIWDGQGTNKGVHYALARTPTGGLVKLTGGPTAAGTQGGSINGNRVTTGITDSMSIFVDGVLTSTITLPAEFADYRDSVEADWDGDGELDVVVTGIHSTDETTSVIVMHGPAPYSTWTDISGWEGIKHDNPITLTIAGLLRIIVTEEATDTYGAAGLGIVMYDLSGMGDAVVDESQFRSQTMSSALAR